MATCASPGLRLSSSDTELSSASHMSVSGFRDGKAIILPQNGALDSLDSRSSPDFRQREYQAGSRSFLFVDFMCAVWCMYVCMYDT